MAGRRSAFILLAAGSASRMGQPKQLLPWNGMPLLRWSALQAIDAGCDETIVVLGANAEVLAPCLEGLRVSVVRNENWDQGMGSSIHCGVNEALARGCEVALLAVADTPGVTGAHYRHLLELQQQTSAPVVASAYASTVGVPVVFDQSQFADLMALRPAEGCKGLILKSDPAALRVPCPEASLDIDTPEEYHLATSPVSGLV